VSTLFVFRRVAGTGFSLFFQTPSDSDGILQGNEDFVKKERPREDPKGQKRMRPINAPDSSLPVILVL
jgi:hypothetical protein